jgi:uncharacterized membrane protein YjjP (DUF1212 family)
MVVTNREQKIFMATPQAVIIITRKEIDQEQTTTIADLSADIPFGRVADFERILADNVSNRGVSVTAVSDENKLIITADRAPKYYRPYNMQFLLTSPSPCERLKIPRESAQLTPDSTHTR